MPAASNTISGRSALLDAINSKGPASLDVAVDDGFGNNAS